MAMPQTNEADCQVIAACVQFDVRRGDVEANLAAVGQGLEDAAGRGARICVLPEMWSTSFLPRFPAPVLQAAAAAESKLLELSRRHGMMIVGSSPEATADGVHNSARVYDRGTALGVYRKIHLFSPNAEHKHHASGGVPLVIDSEVGRIGVMICYDIRFPELARYYFRKGVEIMLVPAQWPEVRSQHWRTLLRARAIENEMFVIGCNRTGQESSLKNADELLTFPGDGRIVDPTGEILASGTGEAGPVTAQLELRTVRTMRRILPVSRDQRPSVYRRLLDDSWEEMRGASRERAGHDG